MISTRPYTDKKYLLFPFSFESALKRGKHSCKQGKNWYRTDMGSFIHIKQSETVSMF